MRKLWKQKQVFPLRSESHWVVYRSWINLCIIVILILVSCVLVSQNSSSFWNWSQKGHKTSQVRNATGSRKHAYILSANQLLKSALHITTRKQFIKTLDFDETMAMCNTLREMKFTYIEQQQCLSKTSLPLKIEIDQSCLILYLRNFNAYPSKTEYLWMISGNCCLTSTHAPLHFCLRFHARV